MFEDLEDLSISDYYSYLDKYVKDNYYDKKMLESNQQYCSISDLAKRFICIDAEYDNTPWTLKQILTNIRMVPYNIQQNSENNLSDDNKQIREDTIDECKDLVEGILTYYRNEYRFGATFNTLCNTLLDRLNQLKEQK